VNPVKVAVFASGAGTTLQALLDHERETQCGWRVALVVADRSGIGALERARAANVPHAVIAVSGRPAEAVGEEMLRALAGVDLVALAGYLKLIPEPVVNAFEDRMLNVHPALLPAFGGQGMYGSRVHQAVLEAGVQVTGPTVHLVDAHYDRGRPLAQWPVPIINGDTAEAIGARVRAVERRLYPKVLDHVADALRRNQAPTPLPLTGTTFRLGPSTGDLTSDDHLP